MKFTQAVEVPYLNITLANGMSLHISDSGSTRQEVQTAMNHYTQARYVGSYLYSPGSHRPGWSQIPGEVTTW